MNIIYKTYLGRFDEMNKRLTELDSLRGIAAIVVIISHIIVLFPSLPTLIILSPLRIFWAGYESVILFFILSGYVLILPFINGNPLKVKTFLIKRAFRIYVPYFVAIVFSIILKGIFFTNTNEKFPWGDIWTRNVSSLDFIHHFTLVSNFKTGTIDPVIWSLVHEMRISIIFPVIVFMILRLKWVNSLGIALILTVIGILFDKLGLSESKGYLNSYGYTIHYTSMFIIGSLLAMYQSKIVEKLKGMDSNFKASLFVVGILVYTMQVGLSIFIKLSFIHYVSDWFIAFGAIIFIMISLSSRRISNFLSVKVIEFFGKISYSLYLFHLPILIATLYLLHGKLPIWMISVIAVSISIVISYLSWKYVEMYSIKLGKTISNRMELERTSKSIKKIS
jgi:peptidoglycan/LPS O-acetylase OafA/YrhL